MARFKPDPDFKLVVSSAATGEGVFAVTGRNTIRRQRRTVETVAQLIIEQAKEETRNALPSMHSSGRKNINYIFSKRDRKGRRYIDSFDYFVRREQGRMVFVVINTHPWAQAVENGNAEGERIEREEGYFALPITEGALRKIRRNSAAKSKLSNAGVNSRHRDYKRVMERLRYHEKAQESFNARAAEANQRAYAALRKSQDRRRSQKNRERLENEAFDARQEALTRRRASSVERLHRARSQAARVRGIAGADRKRENPRAFVGRNEQGQPTLFTRSFRTYEGYGILRRAARRVTLRTLE